MFRLIFRERLQVLWHGDLWTPCHFLNPTQSFLATALAWLWDFGWEVEGF